LTDILRDILYFPVWWYSRGLKFLLLKLADILDDKQRGLALFVWIKNIFKPMYGQYDWAGILISFFMRLVQIIIRGIAMLFWLVLVAAILAVWLALPVVAVWQIIVQLK